MKNTTKNITVTGVCIAIAVLLPMVFHTVPNGGSIFLPMHIPVLFCGLACGWQYGLLCGAISPILSSLITGMPPAAKLPSMVVELAVYGLAASFMMLLLKVNIKTLKLYLSLVIAMLAGRLASGIVGALIFARGTFAVSAWLTASFVTGLPGIAIQLVLIPLLYTVLVKAKLLPSDSAKGKGNG